MKPIYEVPASCVTIESLKHGSVFRLTDDINAQEYHYSCYFDGVHEAYKMREHFPTHKPEIFQHGTLVFPYVKKIESAIQTLSI